MDKTIEFKSQWTNRPVRVPQEFKEPTCTVPNQSMTVAQIIAKFSRLGIIPAVKDTLQGGRFLQRLQPSWDGDNRATDPEFDPLDNGQDFLDETARQKAEQEAAAAAAAETKEAPAGDGGENAPSPA